MTHTNDHSARTFKRRPVYIIDGARTPFLKTRGVPGPFSAADLAVAAGRTLLLRQPFSPADLDEVILGCVIPAATEANIARVVSLRLGCGERVPAWTVQRNCASGMQALASAAERISNGYADLIVAGGSEAMSHAPLLWNRTMVEKLAALQQAKTISQRLKIISSLRPRDFKPVIALLQGLTDPTTSLIMGQTAENLAHRFQITRQMMDEYSLGSHARLALACDEHKFPEIVTLYTPSGEYIQEDQGLRRDGDLNKLGQLKAVFDPPYGHITAGNSAQVTDGAALVLLASEEAVSRYQLPVSGEIIDTSWAGLAPAEMGLGPVYAMDTLLRKHPHLADKVGLWEINEAFAAQVLACLAALQDVDWQHQELGQQTVIPPISRERLNVNGGAIAIGHPVGASGARIVLQLLQALKQHEKSYGIASLCIGGGQGGAMLIHATVHNGKGGQ